MNKLQAIQQYLDDCGFEHSIYNIDQTSFSISDGPIETYYDSGNLASSDIIRVDLKSYGIPFSNEIIHADGTKVIVAIEMFRYPDSEANKATRAAIAMVVIDLADPDCFFQIGEIIRHKLLAPVKFKFYVDPDPGG